MVARSVESVSLRRLLQPEKARQPMVVTGGGETELGEGGAVHKSGRPNRREDGGEIELAQGAASPEGTVRGKARTCE